ncbi:hypothetical protein [Acinetobacter baumannii]|uniref:hypothetical protein n=1 Tax=Acinetobacter baumannii TaxID=470 RepID=UPI001C447874|nr:hypothetical protein [Acinetobacter baumannii]MBV6768387.1 hypothetical protein [Acinetobacter baumannii]
MNMLALKPELLCPSFGLVWLYMLLNLNRTMPRKQFNLVLISSCKRSTNSAKDRAKEQQHDRFE